MSGPALIESPRGRRATPHRSRRIAVVAALLGILAAVGGAAWAGIGQDQSGAQSRALADTRAFLRTYVKPSGQVVRPDQGGDTVSEGQAYGLLLAEGANQPATFRRIWDWMRAHLQRPNGELAYLAAPDGAVQDPMPAADADVLTAWALGRTRGPGAARYHTAARRLAAAILANETVRRGSMLLLAAGPWATGSPASLDPSYWSLPAFTALAHFTGDRRWWRLAASALALTRTLTDAGRRLPPDWARLDGAAVHADPAPNGSEPQVRYGLDAQRLVVWLAVSCLPRARALAARWWRILGVRGRAAPIALSPEGAVIDADTNALPHIAAAAAARAANDARAASRQLAAAREVQARYPTYYGGAWLALGELLLSGQSFRSCGATGGGA
jgi:endo-1,4-beta-D-glucanase Y